MYVKSDGGWTLQFGRTPVDVAVENGHETTAALLRFAISFLAVGTTAESLCRHEEVKRLTSVVGPFIVCGIIILLRG